MKGYVAAIIRDAGGRFLMLHHKAINKWVFPGGKPEDGEAFTSALVRELKEELDIFTAPAHIRYYGAAAHKVKGDDWVGVFFTVKAFKGNPQVMEPAQHSDAKWMSVDDMERTYDVPIVEYNIAEAINDLEG